MAKAKNPLSKKCRPGINYRFCKSKKGCPWHGTTATFQLIRSIWTNNDKTSNLKRMTKLTNPRDETTRAELWYWDPYLRHVQSITTEDHQSRMQSKNHPAHSPKYHRISSSDLTMTGSPNIDIGFVRESGIPLINEFSLLTLY
jgi:hypothetical protein